MSLKGHTKIELTDVNTGEVEVVEEDNMITNGLQEFLTSYGLFGSNLLGESPYDSLTNIRAQSLYTLLLGGLFLFDTPLDENVGNTFMPAGVTMVGKGVRTQVSNSGDTGSYNSEESGEQPDGSIKFVYDFSTNQANGAISCVCLTSQIGGYIGMGNNDSAWYYSIYRYTAFVGETCYSNIPGISDSSLQFYKEYHFLFASYNDNAVYLTNPYNMAFSSAQASQHWSTTKKMQILKVRAGFTAVGIKDSRNLNQVIETYEVNIPQSILNYMGTKTGYVYAHCDAFERNIFFVFSSTQSSSYSAPGLKAGESCWIMKVDKDMKVTAYEFINNTGVSLQDYKNTWVFNGEYVWIQQGNNTLFGIKYSDSTQIIKENIKTKSTGGVFSLGKNLLGFLHGAQYKEDKDTKYFPPAIYDAVNHTFKYTNGTFNNSGNSYSGLIRPFSDKPGIFMYIWVDGTEFRMRILKDPRYLATINNLSEPVIKTASKTMKVTYTLTQNAE